MAEPIIGVTADLGRRENGVHIGNRRQYLNDNYVKSVLMAGGAPIILPVITEEKLITRQIDIIDGLLLSGGGDINPLLFGEEPEFYLGGVDADRDVMEIILVKAALQKQIPILAICRGIQILNVACGGTLYQHLPPEIFKVQHQQKTAGDFASHTVLVESGSKLASICGEKTVVNSFHHQAVKSVSDSFRVAAKSIDGVIEAIECPDPKSFVVGVQWHPEIMTETSPDMLRLFRVFVEAAKSH